MRSEMRSTAWKVSVLEAFPVRTFPHSDWIRENADQKNSEYGHFSRRNLFPMFVSFYSSTMENNSYGSFEKSLVMKRGPLEVMFQAPSDLKNFQPSDYHRIQFR